MNNELTVQRTEQKTPHTEKVKLDTEEKRGKDVQKQYYRHWKLECYNHEFSRTGNCAGNGLS